MMPRFIRKSKKKAGDAPGTLVHVGDRKSEQVSISLIAYNPDHVIEERLPDVETAAATRPATADATNAVWINIEGLHDVALIDRLGQRFNIHPLVLEDILNTNQRPKYEEYDDYMFIVLKMLRFDANQTRVLAEQISLVISDDCLVSFQEAAGDVFEPVRERIRKGRGRIRGGGNGYLAYTLLDAVVDHYFLILERIGEKIDTYEAELLDSPTDETLHRIHELKREIIFLRKEVWPLREILNQFIKSENPLIRKETLPFLRDVHDHAVHIIDTIESFRDILSGMIDQYMSTVSNRMNEVMKLLTIIATIFIPITFIAGIYGMNFKYMPELEWRWGYFGIWGVMIFIAFLLLIFFKRKKWL